MKAIAILLVLTSLAFPALAEANVNLTASLSKDFIGSTSLDQAVTDAVQALQTDQPFAGVGWEVVLNHFGLGGSYLVNFHDEIPGQWWLDWNSQAFYISYHLFGGRAFLDPFVDAGVGCAGRVFLGPEGNAADKLDLTLYPFVSGGAALNLGTFRAGAKLSWSPFQGGIPVTSIPMYPLGSCQVTAFVGVSLGGRF